MRRNINPNSGRQFLSDSVNARLARHKPSLKGVTAIFEKIAERIANNPDVVFKRIAKHIAGDFAAQGENIDPDHCQLLASVIMVPQLRKDVVALFDVGAVSAGMAEALLLKLQRIVDHAAELQDQLLGIRVIVGRRG